MAEPDWALLQGTLQQLQTDNAEFKRLFAQVLSELGELRRGVENVDIGVSQAVALATRALTRAGDANTTTLLVERRLEELTARVHALEGAR